MVALRSYFTKILSQSDVDLVFDRYKDHSIKSRQERLSPFRRSHNLSLSSSLPAKEIAMRVTDTKQQLTEMTKNDLIKNTLGNSDKLFITAQAEAPEQV